MAPRLPANKNNRSSAKARDLWKRSNDSAPQTLRRLPRTDRGHLLSTGQKARFGGRARWSYCSCSPALLTTPSSSSGSSPIRRRGGLQPQDVDRGPVHGPRSSTEKSIRRTAGLHGEQSVLTFSGTERSPR